MGEEFEGAPEAERRLLRPGLIGSAGRHGWDAFGPAVDVGDGVAREDLVAVRQAHGTPRLDKSDTQKESLVVAGDRDAIPSAESQPSRAITARRRPTVPTIRLRPAPVSTTLRRRSRYHRRRASIIPCLELVSVDARAIAARRDGDL